MTDDPPPITTLAQFFDDVRVEANGKLILIGQYSGDLMFPLGMPSPDQIAILVTSKWPRSYTPSALGIKINIPGQPPVIPPSLQIPEHQPLDDPPSPFAGMLMQAMVQCRLPPLRGGDFIDVWILADGHELPAGRLRIVTSEALAASTDRFGQSPGNAP